MMTLKSLLAEGREVLTAAQIADADIDAWLLLQYVTGINRMMYLMEPDKSVSNEDTLAYHEVIARRATHYPLQYITHTQEFMGLDFYVDERVLIPRQDTEVLVEMALEFLKDGMTVLDMCTGSGCILISLAANRRLASGLGVDLSEGALEVAQKNARANGLDQLEWIQSSLFEAFENDLDKSDKLQVDMIVSNPPYIESEVIPTLMPEVRAHEPMMALDGFEDGLYFYREITANAPAYLKNKGYLLFEIGYNQGEAVADLMRMTGFVNIRIKKDLAGLDRVVYGQWIDP
jgi:release factor glutamine methyltransferase